MDIVVLHRLKEDHAGFRLMRAQNFPFIASFLWKTFPGSNVRVIDAESLQSLLEDFVFQHPESGHHAAPQDILKSWVEAGYLRQYYTDNDDLSRYELTTATEQALDWVYGLQPRGFIGTESRLKTIFELLEDLRQQTEKNIQKRVSLLQAERQRIDLAIEKVLAGEIELLSDLQIRERFAQLEDMARQLLRDFSEVEQNFRNLDRSIRSRIARLDGSRGDVLHSVFDEKDQIRQSEQGRSFAAFCEFLMSHSRQEQLEELLDYLFDLEPIQNDEADPFLGNLQSRLLEASDKVQATQSQLSAQLRRFLDERARLENTRINRLIQGILEDCMLHKEDLHETAFSTSLDDVTASIHIPTRSLYRIPLTLEKQQEITTADDKEVSPEALLAIDTVDDKILWSRIRACLETRSPVTLGEVLQRFPLEKGLAELVAYVRLASQSHKSLVDEEQTFLVLVPHADGYRQVTAPHIIFSR